MRRGRRGKQTKRTGRRIRWGRLLSLLFALAAFVGVIALVVTLLSGGTNPLSGITSGLKSAFTSDATPTPTIPSLGLAQSAESPASTARPLSNKVALSPVNGTSADDLGIKTELLIDGETAETFARDGDLRFLAGDQYTGIPGILTFGGNNYRDTFTYGIQNVSEKRFEIIHEENMGSLKTGDTSWSGACFTGMPIIVEWPAVARKNLGVKSEFKNKEGFVEVIYPAADGYIYFLELTSGKSTREPIKLGVVTKGTASLDPRGYPLLYVGQGDISRNSSGRSGAWFRVIDLISNTVVWDFGQRDPFSYREWQGYSSSALIHAGTDTLIIPGENGIFYTVKLNTEYNPTEGTVSVNPDNLEKYRYTAEGYSTGADAANKKNAGIVSSAAVFRNYAYFTDNGGLLQCVDLNTLKLEYAVNVTDAGDSSPVLEEDPANHTFYIYTGSKVDKQAGAQSTGSGVFYHRKIDGQTGAVIWEARMEASYSDGNGGARGTPHVGRGKLSDVVIFNSTHVPVEYTDANGNKKTGPGGRINTYSKSDGKIISTYEQSGGYWSSPVVIYDGVGNGYLIQCDRNGIMRMHDPLDLGSIYTEINLGSRVESTPSVFGDYLVVGTRGSDSVSAKIVIVRIK